MSATPPRLLVWHQPHIDYRVGVCVRCLQPTNLHASLVRRIWRQVRDRILDR